MMGERDGGLMVVTMRRLRSWTALWTAGAAAADTAAVGLPALTLLSNGAVVNP